MRTKPSIDYSGLTIILDEPSRFDLEFGRLLSGPAREFMDHDCFPSGYSVDSSDIRTADCTDPLLSETKAILLGGEKTAQKFARVSIDPPGYTTIALSKLALPIFYPQDCCDHKNMRSSANEDFEDAAATDRDTKEKMPTRRKNWRFWNSWHIQKFLANKFIAPPKLHEKLFPRLDEIIHVLEKTKDSTIYLDIETSRVYRCMSCIGFATSDSFPTIYVVPTYLVSGVCAYREFHLFYRALSLALSRNEVVIHNAMFDVMVLHGFYKMCLPQNIYDTMCGQHRIFPESEKSLAHTISTWTNLPNHKNFDTEVYNDTAERNLWHYNAQDVYALKLIKDAQLDYANKDPGLMASINQANESIIPYLTTSLKGLRLDTLLLSKIHGDLLKKQHLFERMATILAGKPFNPGSSKQCADFFHKNLHYPIVSRTKQGAPALGSKQLYQLQLKHNNPLIPVILKYREAAKDASSLESELFTLP